MARPRKLARVQRWRGEWYLFYTDHSSGRQKRVAFSALNAFNHEQRQELVQQYRSQEINQQAEVLRRGGVLAYDSSLIGELNDYLDDVARRVKVRSSNQAARRGLSAATAQIANTCVKHFIKWLHQTQRGRLVTGALDVRALRSYVDDVAIESSKNGNSEVMRSAATISQYARNIRTALNWIASKRPPRFPDVELLRSELRVRGSAPDTIVAYKPDELLAFFKAAKSVEQPGRPILVQRKKTGGKQEEYLQRTNKAADTPVWRLFLLLALTGCRRGEALGLKWSHIDLERGLVQINSQKTGNRRWLPLVDAPEGPIAPQFAKLLEKWHDEAEGREYVLPHGQLDVPAFPQGAWQRVNKTTTVVRIGPQRLRSNFTSYCASIGIPAAVAAMWLGHSAEVAERNYRRQVLSRKSGKSIEAAMGLDDVVAALLREEQSK